MDVTKNKSYYYFFFVYSMFGIFPPSINHSSYHRFLGFPLLVSASCFFSLWFFFTCFLFYSTRFYWIQDEKYRFTILFITYSMLLIIQKQEFHCSWNMNFICIIVARCEIPVSYDFFHVSNEIYRGSIFIHISSYLSYLLTQKLDSLINFQASQRGLLNRSRITNIVIYFVKAHY